MERSNAPPPNSWWRTADTKVMRTEPKVKSKLTIKRITVNILDKKSLLTRTVKCLGGHPHAVKGALRVPVKFIVCIERLNVNVEGVVFKWSKDQLIEPVSSVHGRSDDNSAGAQKAI